MISKLVLGWYLVGTRAKTIKITSIEKSANILNTPVFIFVMRWKAYCSATDESFRAASQKAQELREQCVCSQTYSFKISPEASAPSLSGNISMICFTQVGF